MTKQFEDLEAKLVHEFLFLESQNDKANREIKEHKSIIESTKVTKNILLESCAKIQKIRNED